MKDSRSEPSGHNLNARLLRFRSQPESEDPRALAEALLAAKRYGDARGVAVNAQPKDREDGSLLTLEGRAWLLERDLVRAQAVLLRAVRAAPDLAEAYRWLGYVLLKRGDPQRAAKTLQRAIALDPNDIEAAKLATRAEYLAEAANDSLVPPDADPIDAPTARRSSAGSLDAPAPRRSNASSFEAPAARSGPVQPIARSRDGAARTDAHHSTANRVRESQRNPPASSTPPQVLRARPARETAPVVDPRDDRVDSRKPASSKPYGAGQDDASRPQRGHVKPDEEPTSEFRRVPMRDAQGREVNEPDAPLLGGQPSPARTDPAGRTPSGTLAMPTPRKSLDDKRDRESSGRAPPPLASSGRAAPPSSSARAAPPSAAAAFKPAPNVALSRARSAQLDAETAPLDFPKESASGSLDVSDLSLVEITTSTPIERSDLELGAERREPADADAAFALLERLGLFEQPRGVAAAWSGKDEVEVRGTRLRNALIGLWAVTLLGCVGGYFGWQAFVASRHAKAAQWVDQARAAMSRGDHGSLVDGERLLRLAREQHPASQAIPREALLLQVERVLEDGERDLAALRSAFARARASGVDGPVVSLATAVMSGFSGELAARDRALAETLSGAQGDARLLYLVGRYEQRAGRAEALAHLQAAAKADPKLVPAQLALAEIALDAGDKDAALAQVNAALAIDPEHLRARLFRLFLQADDSDAGAIDKNLSGLSDSMKKAGAIDRALEALVRARLLRRQGQRDAAGQAVEAAGNAGADEPRLLAWMAREALAVGKLPLAQHLASQALSAAPDVAQNRRLLARILIERSDGEHALQLLDKLPADDSEAQIMKAQAALLSSDETAWRAGLDGLTQLQAAKRDATRVGALRVRLEAKLTPGHAVVERARALVHAAPGDPEALLALAEAGLSAREPATTQAALKQRFAVEPDDPNAFYLLGRARRMAGDASEAEAAFRRAIELAPGHGDALLSLAELLLDEGKYAEADGVYQELATRGGSAAQGRLGRVDALLALGRLDDAQVQLDALPEAQQASAPYRMSAARLALARNKPGDALTSLRALVDTQADKVSVMTLYGDALVAAEQFEPAASAYDAALAIDPELPEALLGRAEVQLHANKVKEALALLQKAKDALSKRIRPPSVQARRLMISGEAYTLRNKRGDQDAARDALREAVKQPNPPPLAYFLLAEALGGRGNPEGRADYQRYLELDPHGRYQERARRALGAP